MALGKSAVVAGVGCAVACVAVTIVPAVLAGATLGGIVAALRGEAGIALVLILAAGGVWLVRRRQGRAKATESCQCPADDGCNTKETYNAARD